MIDSICIEQKDDNETASYTNRGESVKREKNSSGFNVREIQRIKFETSALKKKKSQETVPLLTS